MLWFVRGQNRTCFLSQNFILAQFKHILFFPFSWILGVQPYDRPPTTKDSGEAKCQVLPVLELLHLLYDFLCAYLHVLPPFSCYGPKARRFDLPKNRLG